MENLLNQEVFEKEIAMCRELSQKNGGKCNWGECAKCGVVPLLYKLSKGEFYDKEGEIDNLREKHLTIR